MGYLKCSELLWIFSGSKKQLQTTVISTWLTFPSLMIKVCKQITQKKYYSIISKAFPDCKI